MISGPSGGPDGSGRVRWDGRGRRPPTTLAATGILRRGRVLFNAPTADQVRALAPDAAAARAGEGLASIRHWPRLGRTDRLLWGLCQGSGKDPYQVAVDLAGPTFKCSCPSRKFPCKHGLGIMLLHALQGTAFTASDAPAWATDWLAARDVRAAESADRSARAPEVDAVAQARRIESRERKVAAGLDGFDRWLRDLLRRGLVAAKGEGYEFWDAAGARLVDAQAAALGRSVRGFAAITNAGPAWGERALEHAARLHLVVEGYRRLDALPSSLQDDVRGLVGWTVKEDDLAEADALTDRWLTVGRTVTADERLTTARTWLLGETSGRWVLHLAFAPNAAPPPIAVVGGSLTGTAVCYPSASPLRAILREGAVAGPAITAVPHGQTIVGAAEAFGARLATDPYLERWPTVLADVVPIARDGRLRLRDASGAEAAVRPPGIAARLLALAGGEPVTAVGLWSGSSLSLLSVLAGGRLVDMAAEGGDLGEAPATGGDPDWERLVSAALLGTDRLAEARDGEDPGDPVGGRSIGSLGLALAEREPAAALLGAAAVAMVRRRAGWLPPVTDAPPPLAAATDRRPVIGPGPTWHLRRILDERHDLLGEWLALAARTGRRPPDEELPRLLAMAGRDASVRDGLAPLLGPRAAWLVEQLPELASGMPTTAGTAMQDPAATFEAATSPELRAAVVASLRATDPGTARELVLGAWDDAGAEDRAALLGGLRVALSADDEALLDRGRTDRRAEVRAVAIDLLARLPGSSLSRLAEDTVRPLLAAEGRFRPSLAVTLPSWSGALEELRISRKPPHGVGERAWWLRQLLELVDPQRSETWLSADPAGCIERALRSDEARPILEGWLGATRRFTDQRWAAALLASRPVVDGRASPAPDLLGLLEVLDPVAREATVAGMLTDADAETAARLVTACPRPWSSELARASIAALVRAGSQGYPPQGFYDHLRVAVRRIPPSRADDLQAAILTDERRRQSTPIRDALEILRSRQQLSQAFDLEPKESR